MALEAQVSLADSATQSERTLKTVTEQALESERLAHQATTTVAGQMKAEIGALKSARRWDRFKGAGMLAAVVTLAVLTR